MSKFTWEFANLLHICRRIHAYVANEKDNWIARKPRAQRAHKLCWKAQLHVPLNLKWRSNIERLVEIPIGYRNSDHTKRHPKLDWHCLLTRPARPQKAHYFGFTFSIEKAPLQAPGIATGPLTPSWVSPCSWNPRASSTNESSFQILWILKHLHTLQNLRFFSQRNILQN